MEMETTLPPGTQESPGPLTPDPGSDGLAADLAVEHGAGPGADSSQGNPGKPAKGKPGRPIIHGKYSQANGSDGKNPVQTVGGEPIPALEVDGGPESTIVLPPHLLAECVQEALTIVEGVTQTKVEAVAVRAGLTPAEVQPYLREAIIGDKRKALLGKLTPLIFREWGMDANVSPTAAAVTLLVPYMGAAALSYISLARLAAKRLAMENSKQPGNPPGKLNPPENGKPT
jgi:hypothetical protein